MKGVSGMQETFFDTLFFDDPFKALDEVYEASCTYKEDKEDEEILDGEDGQIISVPVQD